MRRAVLQGSPRTFRCFPSVCARSAHTSQRHGEEPRFGYRRPFPETKRSRRPFATAYVSADVHLAFWGRNSNGEEPKSLAPLRLISFGMYDSVFTVCFVFPVLRCLRLVVLSPPLRRRSCGNLTERPSGRGQIPSVGRRQERKARSPARSTTHRGEDIPRQT